MTSDCEDGLEDLHTAPARMAVDGGKGDEASTAVARETALEEQIQEQRQKID